MTVRRLSRVLLVVATVAVVGCGGPPAAVLVSPSPLGASTAPSAPASASASVAPGTSAPASDLPAPSGDPRIAFAQPPDGPDVPAGEVRFSMSVGGISLVDKVGAANAGGEGHVIYYVGVDFVPRTPGRSAMTAPGTSVASAEPSYTWTGVQPGTYVVAAQLVNNDDTPLEPSVAVQTTATVK